jgi:hypothetical protein
LGSPLGFGLFPNGIKFKVGSGFKESVESGREESLPVIKMLIKDFGFFDLKEKGAFWVHAGIMNKT